MNTLDRRSALRAILGAGAAGAFSLAGRADAHVAPSSQSNQLSPAPNEVAIFGATPSGIIAAMAASRLGARVTLIEPTQHIGGAITSGLGVTDSELHSTIGGLVAKFYRDIHASYGGGSTTPQYTFEPKVVEDLFNDYIGQYSIKLKLGLTLSSVHKEGTEIEFVVLSDGSTVTASQWIDASYEGDLMALAGASYAVGRESSSQYNESLAGFGIQSRLSPGFPIDGPDGKLWPDLLPYPPLAYGDADQSIMAYTFRVVMCTDPANMEPFPQPPGYDPARFGALRTFMKAAGVYKLSELFSPQAIPNNKYLLLSDIAFSADHSGANWKYPDANPADRAQIWQDHYSYVAGWLYFIANDPSVKASVRTEMAAYGLAADEFTDHGNWPYQMYVREARRLKGQYVMTQIDFTGNTSKSDRVAKGCWNFDSHQCGIYAIAPTPIVGSSVAFDGYFFRNVKLGYEIPFRALLPDFSEVSNLIVPVCCSASHVGFSALRVEPTYMTLGEVAGTAAVLSFDSNSGLQGLNISALQSRLQMDGCVL